MTTRISYPEINETKEPLKSLESRERERERLSRTIAHELSNVVSALTVAIGILGEPVDERKRGRMVKKCSRMLSDMTRILNDLLDYNALIAGHSQLILEQFSLPKLFEEIVAKWKPVAEEHGLVFEKKCDPALGQIVSDKLKLQQIAGNLISNAIKYRMHSEGEFVGISFSASESKGWKMLVTGTGIEIAPEDMDALLGQLGQAQSKSPHPALTGTSLGLALCGEFAEMLGGHLAVRSEGRKGAEFEATFPASELMPSKPSIPGSREARDEIAEAGQPPFQIL